jgi:TetR/AcrR family transcriptional repressor of nem operon
LQLFWRKGYSATSVEDLSSVLHLSRSSLYGTFGDKRTLFLEALRFYSEHVLSRTAQTLQDAPSPIAGIRTLFDELAAGAGSERSSMGCFMINSIAELVPYDPDVTAIATSYSQAFQRLLADTVMQAAAQNLLTSEQTPAEFAAYLFNALQGMWIMLKSGATREQVDAIRSLTLKSLH